MYTHFEHRHRFCAWAAARAAQRAWLSSDHLIRAVESSGLPDYVRGRTLDSVTAEEFDLLHGRWARALLASLGSSVGASDYGRAAKLISIYLKGMVVIGADSDAELACVAHPPVDAILLNAVAIGAELPKQEARRLKSARWTQFTHDEYFDVIETLRMVLAPGEPFWTLERFWAPTRGPRS